MPQLHVDSEELADYSFLDDVQKTTQNEEMDSEPETLLNLETTEITEYDLTKKSDRAIVFLFNIAACIIFAIILSLTIATQVMVGPYNSVTITTHTNYTQTEAQACYFPPFSTELPETLPCPISNSGFVSFDFFFGSFFLPKKFNSSSFLSLRLLLFSGSKILTCSIYWVLLHFNTMRGPSNLCFCNHLPAQCQS